MPKVDSETNLTQPSVIIIIIVIMFIRTQSTHK